MRWGAAAGLLAGLGLAWWLLDTQGLADILDLLHEAGWGVPLVVGYHAVQLFASSEAWRAATGPLRAQAGVGRFFLLRWIRQGINTMLPVAQIGGEVVGARLLHRCGIPLPLAVAGSVADVVIGVLTQILFTLAGLAILVAAVGMSSTAGWVLAGTGAAAVVVTAVVAGLWFGLAGLAGRSMLRLAVRLGWAAGSSAAGVGRLDEAMRSLGRNRRGLVRSGLLHLLSWLLGGTEACLALHVLGTDVGFAEGLAIEALAQGIRTAAFLVPGGVGVAEGGYVVVCALFGLPADLAIALALLKRLREVAFGLPALAAWQVLELRQSPAAKARKPA